jgi:Do/DeqQ family serine protease
MKAFRFVIFSAFLCISFAAAFADVPAAGDSAGPGGAGNFLRRINDAFSGIYEKNAPAVVIIDTSKKITSDEGGDMEGFDFFFRNPQGGGDRDPQDHFKLPSPTTKSEGSGFIVRPEGYIFTNYHVIEGADKLDVRLKDGRHFTAKVVGADEKSDIAVLKIDAAGLPTVQMGDSDSVKVGQLVCSIGIPFNLDYSFTCGWVSAKGRTGLAPGTMYEDYIQTDSFVNPGDSGGPVLDVDGRVVGMNTLINGIGRKLTFAIPANMLKEIGFQLIATGKIVRPWLGIKIGTLNDDPALRELMKGIDHGVVVNAIEGGAPAYKSDLRVTDVITQVDGKDVLTAHELQGEVLKKKVGQSVELTVWRNGETLKVAVVTGELPADLTKVSNAAPKKDVPDGRSDPYGLQFQDLTRELSEKLKPKAAKGAIVTGVLPNSPAAIAGVQREDLITEVDSQPVADAASCKEMIARHDSGKGVLLFIDRKGQKTYAVLKTDQ